MASSSETGKVGAADPFKTEFSDASAGSERGEGAAGGRKPRSARRPGGRPRRPQTSSPSRPPNSPTTSGTD